MVKDLRLNIMKLKAEYFLYSSVFFDINKNKLAKKNFF